MKNIFTATALFLSMNCFADVPGAYNALGKLLQPQSQQCSPSIDVTIKEQIINISAFNCATAQFPSITAIVSGNPNTVIGATLKDASGTVVGGLTSESLSYSANGNTVRITLLSPTKGDLNFYGNGIFFRGVLTKTK